MILPPLYAIRSHPFRNLPPSQRCSYQLCGLHGRFIFAFKICTLWHICQTVHIEIFTRVVVVTPMAQVLPIWFALSLSLSLFSPSLFALFLQNLTPRLVHPGPFMGQPVDHAYVTPRYCTGLEQFLYGSKPIPSGTAHYDCNFCTRCDVKPRLHRGFLAVRGERK